MERLQRHLGTVLGQPHLGRDVKYSETTNTTTTHLVQNDNRGQFGEILLGLELLTLPEGADDSLRRSEGTALEGDHVNLLEVLVKLGVTVGSLHHVTHHGLGQGLGGARLADYEERDAQVNGDDHHPDVLLTNWT